MSKDQDQAYVLGFLFNDDFSKVVLIEKERPDWQRGCLNGLGGHLKQGEDPAPCMSREFYEESGEVISSHNWKNFGRLQGEKFTVFLFAMKSSERVARCKTVTTEKVLVVDSKTFDGRKTVENLAWLVPLAKEACGNGVYIVANYFQ